MAKKSETDVKVDSDEAVDLQPLPMEPVGLGVPLTGVYRLHGDVEYPEYQTDASGAFDLAADLSTHHYHLKCWDAQMNREGQKKVREDSTGRHILLEPGDRILVPTGLVFVYPVGFRMSTYIRSSVGLKKGLSLANSVGFIDNDYRNELFLPLINNTQARVRIDHKERIAQGEVVPYTQVSIVPLDEHPSVVGNRNGGFGSTGSTGKK